MMNDSVEYDYPNWLFNAIVHNAKHYAQLEPSVVERARYNTSGLRSVSPLEYDVVDHCINAAQSIAQQLNNQHARIK